MPYLTSVAVAGHLYRPVEVKSNDKGSYAIVNLYTVSKQKGKEDTFTSWSGFVNGPQAEWLAEGVKGSLVWISGTDVSLDKHTGKDGKEHVSIRLGRVSECRLLERKDGDGRAQRPADVPVHQREAIGGGARSPAIVGAPDDSDPPFHHFDMPA